ncbi:DUF397 domain-containing protein [Saccharopolyspora spinosa]
MYDAPVCGALASLLVSAVVSWMNGVEMLIPQWIKSSYSSANGDCVELTTALDAIRDSKDLGGPTLAVDVGTFVCAVQQGRFDR